MSRDRHQNAVTTRRTPHRSWQKVRGLGFEKILSHLSPYSDNCGYTQQDLADLKRKEIKDGRITRKRRKTRHHKRCRPVSYKLWPIIQELLETELQRHDHAELAIVDPAGRPLKSVSENSKFDVLKNEFRALRVRNELPKGRTLKHIRKTSASLIANKFGDGVAKHFLGHIPNGVAEVHYLKRDQNQLDEAIDWLGRELGIGH